MNRNNVLTQEDFDALLAWLDLNRDQAGISYEKIRQGLIRYFYFKGCSDAEDLADETINRVIKKIPTLEKNPDYKYVTIFYGFASNIYLEELRRKKNKVTIEADFPYKIQENDEERQECLDECLKNLENEERQLLLEYYAKDKSDKFEHRRKLAESIGLTANAMHVKIHRLRFALKKCIEKCLSEK